MLSSISPFSALEDVKGEDFFSQQLREDARYNSASVLIPSVKKDDIVTRYFRRCLQDQVDHVNDVAVHALQRNASRTQCLPSRPQTAASTSKSHRRKTLNSAPPSRSGKSSMESVSAALPLRVLRVSDYGGHCVIKRNNQRTKRGDSVPSEEEFNERIIESARHCLAGPLENEKIVSPHAFQRIKHFLVKETALRGSIITDEFVMRREEYLKLTQKIDFIVFKMSEIPKVYEHEEHYRNHIKIDESKRYNRMYKSFKYEFILILDMVRKSQIEDAWRSIYTNMASAVSRLAEEEFATRTSINVREVRAANVLQVKLHKLTMLMLQSE